MAEAGLAALVVSGPENVLYCTGYESMPAAISRRHDYCAIVTPADVLLVAPAINLAAAVGAGLPRDDVYPYGEFHFGGDGPGAYHGGADADFAAAFARAARRLPPGCAFAGRIGVETGILPAAALAAIPGEPDLAAAAFMLRVRAVKLAEEIELMRSAARMTELAIEAGIAAARRGVTDKAVSRAVAAAMAAAGGFPRNVTVVGGPHSAYVDAFPAERPLADGDLLRFDVGCSYYGYKSDLARTAVIGPPSQLQADRYGALLDGLHAEMRAAGAGVPAREVFAAGLDRIHARGFAAFRRHHLGHAIGLAVYEHPGITPQAPDELELGATFCFETPYYEPGWGGMMCEDTGIVTVDGFTPISSIDRSLRQLQ
jgi:Xaa-Pro aminopeptidase